MRRDDDRLGVDGEHDDLKQVLERWQAPRVPEALDERVLQSYRKAHVRPEPFWQRFFSTSIRVPLPVAVLVVLLLMVSAGLALRHATPPVQEAGTPAGEVQAARANEAPVVTHTSLAGFQPATGGDATVVLESGP